MTENSQAHKVSIRTSHYIIGSLGLIAALAWKETLQHSFDYVFPSMNHIFSYLLQALLLTLITIIAIDMLPNTESAMPVTDQKIISENFLSKKIE